MTNYIAEIDRKELQKAYATAGRFILNIKDLKIFNNDYIDDVNTLYICVKRNIKEPVYIAHESCEGRFGETHDNVQYITRSANGKCVGETMVFTIMDETRVCVDMVDWYMLPKNRKDIVELCKRRN